MFITHGDTQFYAVSFGNSTRTILAIGGWVGSWELWVEPFTALSQTWRTAAYDHRGAGATIAPTESITFETLVDDVFVILDALGIEQCVLAAESAGCAVAVKAALRRPERFTGLVLADGMYYQPMPTAPTPFMLGLRHDYPATLGRFVDTCLTETDGEAIRRWGRQIVGRSSQAAGIRLYEIMNGVDLRPEVSKIPQPTLILHGEQDQIVPVASSQWLATQIPNNHLHIIKEAGHVPTMTHAQEIAGQIDQFFGG